MSSITGATSQFVQTAYTPLTTPPAQADGSTTQGATAQSSFTTPPAAATQQSTAVQQAAATTPPATSQTPSTNPAVLLAHNADGTIGPHHKHVHKHGLQSAAAETADQIASVNVHI